MKFGYGLVTCQRHPDEGRSDREMYDEALALAEDADRLGLDSFWVSEHHLWDDSHMPSLLPTLAAVAARTERIGLGTGVLQVPANNPVRLAEDAATVDLISHDRLTLGLGLGWREEEWDTFGKSKPGAVLMEETIEILREAWGGGLVSLESPEAGVGIWPKPNREGGPPILVGGEAEPSIRRAARLADGWIGTQFVPELFAERLGWIEDERSRVGREGPFEVAVKVAVFPWADGPAWPLVRDALYYLHWKYEDMAYANARATRLQKAPETPEDFRLESRGGATIVTCEAMSEFWYPDFSTALVGTPEEVAAGIRAYREAGGDDIHFIAGLYIPGLDPAVQREALRIYAEQVVPLVGQG